MIDKKIILVKTSKYGRTCPVCGTTHTVKGLKDPDRERICGNCFVKNRLKSIKIEKEGKSCLKQK